MTNTPPPLPPPTGYESWLDYVIGRLPSWKTVARDAAKAELEALRLKIEQCKPKREGE